MSENNRKLDYLNKIFRIALILVIFVISTYIVNFGSYSVSDDIASWGAFGDYIGGLINPLLGFFSFMALLITLDLQREQLRKTEEQLDLNREELRLTREELKKSANAQADAAELMSEQLKTQVLQQFETNFYQLFSQLNKLQDDILSIYNAEIHEILNNNSNILTAKKTLIKNRKLSRYLILLYQIMKLINNRWAEEERLKKFYINLIRSQQDEKILQLIYINCFDEDFLEYREYLEKAYFFKHMSLRSNGDYNFLLLCALPFYVKSDDLQQKNIPFFKLNLGLIEHIESEISPVILFFYSIEKELLKKMTETHFLKYFFEKYKENHNLKISNGYYELRIDMSDDDLIILEFKEKKLKYEECNVLTYKIKRIIFDQYYISICLEHDGIIKFSPPFIRTIKIQNLPSNEYNGEYV